MPCGALNFTSCNARYFTAETPPLRLAGPNLSNELFRRKAMINFIKKTCFVFFALALSVSIVSCGSEKIEYSFEELTEEISDGQYNRNVKILKIESNSEHEEEINSDIYDFFCEKLESYKNGTAVDWQHLYIDTTYTEKDGILCISDKKRTDSSNISTREIACTSFTRITAQTVTSLL